MNLLSLISPGLNINCQITTKCAILPKSKLFCELNTALVPKSFPTICIWYITPFETIHYLGPCSLITSY